MGELPPSDDEYEEYYSDDEPKMDRFGNILAETAEKNINAAELSMKEVAETIEQIKT